MPAFSGYLIDDSLGEWDVWLQPGYRCICDSCSQYDSRFFDYCMGSDSIHGCD